MIVDSAVKVDLHLRKLVCFPEGSLCANWVHVTLFCEDLDNTTTTSFMLGEQMPP